MTEQTYDIHKAAAIIIEDDKAILTRSKDKTVFVPPGGKLEVDENGAFVEDEVSACIRELKEELGIDVEASDLEKLDDYYAEAAGGSGKALKMSVFMVNRYSGQIEPRNEIAEIARVGARIPEDMEVGSIFEHNILPYLRQTGKIA